MSRAEARQPELFAGTTPPQPAASPPATPLLPTRDSDLRAANAWFAVYLRGHRYSDNTIDAYTAAVESLARHLLRPVPLRHIGSRHLQRYVHWLASQPAHTALTGQGSAPKHEPDACRDHPTSDAGDSTRGPGGRGSARSARVPAATVATRIVGLRRFFRALVEAGVLADDPAADLRLPQAPRRLPTILGDDDVVRLRREAERQFHQGADSDALPLLLVILMLDLGLRRSEIEALTAQDVVPHPDGCRIVVRHARPSHRYQNRTLVAPPEFTVVYRAYRHQYRPPAQSLVVTPRRSLYRVVERLGRSAGLSVPLTPAALRWTCARRWYETLPPSETQRRLGLSPIGWQHAEEVLQALGSQGTKPISANPDQGSHMPEVTA